MTAQTGIGHFVVKAWITEGIRPGVVARSHDMGRWKTAENGQRQMMATVRLDGKGSLWTLQRERGVEPFPSRDADTERIWWTDAGVQHRTLIAVFDVVESRLLRLIAEQKHLTGLVRDAIAHRGFSLIDVFSPCVTFNHLNTYPWFKERVYKLDGEEGYDPTDLMAAIGKSLEFGSRIPIGCLYKIDKPIYDDSEPVLQRGPLVDQPLGLNRETFDELLAETM